MTSRLHERYTAEVVPALQKQFEYGNPNQVPRLSADSPEKCRVYSTKPGLRYTNNEETEVSS